MPKIQYKEINFRGKSLDLINLVNQVINEYKNQGYELTLRQTYYQLVARGYIPNNERKADVVITNPTHFAVAVKYDAQKNDAPVVVAKGQDYVAQKIKEIARDNNIHIVENKPLARMLFHNVDLGAEIPPELYRSVAEILAMIYKENN